jgi:hypothetical protein
MVDAHCDTECESRVDILNMEAQRIPVECENDPDIIAAISALKPTKVATNLASVEGGITFTLNNIQ